MWVVDAPWCRTFCEKYYQDTVDRIDSWFDQGPVDLILIVGTSLNVFPAAEYVDRAIERGARVAVFDIEAPDRVEDDLQFGADHWYFQGDASKTLPEVLKSVIGSDDGQAMSKNLADNDKKIAVHLSTTPPAFDPTLKSLTPSFPCAGSTDANPPLEKRIL